MFCSGTPPPPTPPAGDPITPFLNFFIRPLIHFYCIRSTSSQEPPATAGDQRGGSIPAWAHTRALTADAGRATPPPLSALAQLSGKAGRRILAPPHAEAPPRSGSLYFGRISLNSVTKLRERRQVPTAGSLAVGEAGVSPTSSAAAVSPDCTRFS